MKIAIITQPLWDNYGGLLQNWALQQFLKETGHQPITLDLLVQRYPLSLRLNVSFKNILKSIIPFRSFTKGRLDTMIRSAYSESFICDNIITTNRIDRYGNKELEQHAIDCIIVGSDQVWRPRYNIFLDDMFLNFCKKRPLRKISYACSFGVNNWELTKVQTKNAKKLIKQFDYVSVRENSAIKLLSDHLECECTQVLDPTLLLGAEDYERLIPEQIDSFRSEYIAAYILNDSENVQPCLDLLTKRNPNTDIKRFSADQGMSIPVPEWLRTIKNAKFVLTDSFHGAVFCLIFKKEFCILGNTNRGNSRFESLLSNVGLSDRVIKRPEDLRSLGPVNWERVETRLAEQRRISFDFLTQALS